MSDHDHIQQLTSAPGHYYMLVARGSAGGHVVDCQTCFEASSVDEARARARQAGCDLILMSADFKHCIVPV